METYIVFKRFRRKGISGEFNLPYGTIVIRNGDHLFTKDGLCICAVTSENGWNHFRPNTSEAKHRHFMIKNLKEFYRKRGNQKFVKQDLYVREFDPGENDYWLHILRTMSTGNLENLYRKRIKK